MDLGNNYAYNPDFVDPGVCSFNTLLFRTVDRRGRRRSQQREQQQQGYDNHGMAQSYSGSPQGPPSQYSPPPGESYYAPPPQQPHHRQQSPSAPSDHVDSYYQPPPPQQPRDSYYAPPPQQPHRQQSPAQQQPPPQRQQKPPPQRPKTKEIPRHRRPRGAPPGVEISLCVKYTIFFLNLAFWLIGAFILGFGIWGLVSKSLSTVNDLTKEAGFSLDPMVGFIIVGGIIFMLGFCGCIGALRENTCILKFFTYSLILIFIGEIIIGVLGYIYSDQLLEILEVWMFRYIITYFDDPDTQFIVDGMQEGLKCCGSVAPEDWDNNIYLACDSIAVKTRCSVPYSCCLPDEGVDNYQCGYGVRAEPKGEWRQYIHTQGCVEALQYWFIEYAIILGCIGGVLIIMQCITICLGKSLIADIETMKSYW